MNVQTITKRGIESALYVCPESAAASHVVRGRITDGAAAPFQGTGLPVAGFRMTDGAVRTIQQLVPFHPGDTARRPPA